MFDNLFSLDGGFARFMNFLWNLILVSILFVLCCLPVVTIGASATAGYYAMAKAVLHHNGTVIREFFRAFRLNFKQTAVFTLVYIFVLLFLLLDCSYFYNNEAQGSLELLYLFYGMIAIVFAHMHYQFPVISRFTQGKFQHFRMATLLVFRHFLSSILLLALFAATAVGIFLMPWGILVFPGLCVYLQTFLMEKILRKYAPPPAPGEEDKWYYT